MPHKVDVLVIGAGIAGCSAAYYISRAGHSVAVCEKGTIAAEQSSRNWGFVRQQGRDVTEIPAIVESIRLWRGLSKELGADIGYVQSGTLYLADDELEVSQFEEWASQAKAHGIGTILLNRREIADRLPGATGRWIGGMTTATDGRAEPDRVTRAYANALSENGGIVIENCAVRGLDIQGGAIRGAVTENGVIAADAVLLAGGVWSRLFAGNYKIDLPQLTTRSHVLRTAAAPDYCDHSLWCRDVAFRRRADGGYTVAHGAATEAPLTPDSLRLLPSFWKEFWKVRKRLRLRFDYQFWTELKRARQWDLDSITPFERQRIFDARVNNTILRQAEDNLKRLFPIFNNITVVERWAGLIDVTPDALPIIGEVPSHRGLFISTGYSGHGFGIGPGAGKLSAELILGRTPSFDPSPFRFDRFRPDPRCQGTTATGPG